MKLNRTGSNWDRLECNKINENWSIIEGLGDSFGKVVTGLVWKTPVDTVADLPTNAEVGETRMVREADPDGISYVYRYDGEKWEKIQAIDVTLVNEVDRRLSRQLVETEQRLTSLDNKKLDKVVGVTKQELNDGLRPKADQAFVDAQLASIVSGAPKGTYATLQALKDALPNGSEGVFLVLEDGHWYYWNESEKDWLDGGLYQAVSWVEFMTEQDEEWVV